MSVDYGATEVEDTEEADVWIDHSQGRPPSMSIASQTGIVRNVSEEDALEKMKAEKQRRMSARFSLTQQMGHQSEPDEDGEVEVVVEEDQLDLSELYYQVCGVWST